MAESDFVAAKDRVGRAGAAHTSGVDVGGLTDPRHDPVSTHLEADCEREWQGDQDERPGDGSEEPATEADAVVALVG